MCLAQFATVYTYEKSQPSRDPSLFVDGSSTKVSSWQKIYNSETPLPNWIDLQDESLGHMKLRQSGPKVLRYHTPSKKQGHEEYYAKLLLFSAQDNEDDLKRNYHESCRKEYENRKKEIEKNIQGLFPGKELLEVLESSDIGEDDEEEGVIDDPQYQSISCTGNLNPEAPPRKENVRFKKIDMP